MQTVAELLRDLVNIFSDNATTFRKHLDTMDSLFSHFIEEPVVVTTAGLQSPLIKGTLYYNFGVGYYVQDHDGDYSRAQMYINPAQVISIVLQEQFDES